MEWQAMAVSNRAVRNIRVAAAFAASTFVATAVQAQNKSAPDLKAVEAEIAHVEAVLPPAPAQQNGYWEHQWLVLAEVAWSRTLLETARSAQPEVAAYWMRRSSDWDGRNTTNQFILAADKVLRSDPRLSKWADDILSASRALQSAGNDNFEVDSNAIPDQEQLSLRQSINLQGKQRAVRDLVMKMMESLGPLDPSTNPAWNAIYAFLHGEMDGQYSTLHQDTVQKNAVAGGLRKAFLNAVAQPADAGLTAAFATLEPSSGQIRDRQIEAFERAFSPGASPKTFIAKDAAKLIDLQVTFGRDMARVLAMPSFRNADNVRVLDGLWDVRATLHSYRDFVRAGRSAEALDVLEDLAVNDARAVDWDVEAIDPRNGVSAAAATVNQIDQTARTIEKFKDQWIDGKKPDKPLYAAVDADEAGNVVWHSGGWLLWSWMTTDDMDDMLRDGRVVGDDTGRRWLLPAGIDPPSTKAIADFRKLGARMIVIGLDPAAMKNLDRDNKP